VSGGYAALAARMRPVCVEAVDVMEIAAVLESDGITDAMADRRYGSPNVFELAERLRANTPRRPAPSPLVPSPWKSSGIKHPLRGILFALPALCYVTVADQIVGRDSTLVLAVSVLLAWFVGQSLAFLGHIRLGYGDRGGSARVLLGGLLVGTAIMLAGTVGTGLAYGVPAGMLLVASAQILYLGTATVALVLGHEWLLLAALAPGVVAASIGLLIGDGAVRSWPVIGCAAVTILACVVLAWYATRGARPELPTRAELVAALPYGTFGLAVGGLLLFVPMTRTLAPVPFEAEVANAGMASLLPLSLSMGLAEWLLVGFRTWCHTSLQRATSLRAFAVRAGGSLAVVAVFYLLFLALLVVVGALVVRAVTGVRPDGLALTGYILLGGCLFLALALMSFRIRGVAVAGSAAALGAGIVALTVWPVPEFVQLGTAAALLLCLFGYALVALGRASRHL
jgi:hypothetical protein